MFTNFSPMLDHYSHTCNFSSADVPWVYAQGVFACSVRFGGSSIHGLRESVDGWGSASRDSMSILWEPLRVPSVVPFNPTITGSCSRWLAHGFSKRFPILVRASPSQDFSDEYMACEFFTIVWALSVAVNRIDSDFEYSVETRDGWMAAHVFSVARLSPGQHNVHSVSFEWCNDVMPFVRTPSLRRDLPKKTDARFRKPRRKETSRLTRRTRSIFGACKKKLPLFSFSPTTLPVTEL